ncbi:hypothetical protein FKW77_001588 [Venturia effusa]|uniref:Peptidase A1 domain-containing protein n=1 Tax=Venturia effusa TaxID=50376 RepID=A0A517LKV7_9PEZI|nr:hypothetical protein FKW77_001588 [Venturia effusa]
MRSAVFLSLATLVRWSSAFYPYARQVDTHSSPSSTQNPSQLRRSPCPLHSSARAGTDETSDTSLWSKTQSRGADHGALRISLKRTPAKRQNKFSVVAADAPEQSTSAGVDQDGTDFSYFASFKIGTSPKTFYLLLDSAASNTWVMSSDCTTSACGIHTTFGTSDSSSLRVSSKTFSVAYGTGSVKGVQGTDTVHLGAMSANLTFGLALNASDEFLSYPMDGILGLGRPDTLASDLTGIKAPSLLDTLVSGKTIKSKLFGLTLWRSADGGSNDGEINFGSPNPSRYDGEITYIAAIKGTNGFWEIPVADVSVDGKKVGLTGRTAIIDSGTSFVLMPREDAAKLHQVIPGSFQEGESFTVPCDSTAKLQMIFGTTTYDISPKDYVGRPSGSGCASNVVGRQVFGPEQWLVGDVFMKNVYTVFDYDQSRVGFGVKRAGAPKAMSSSSAANNGAKTTQNASATGTFTGSGHIRPTGGLIPGGPIPVSSNPNSSTTSVSSSRSAASGIATGTTRTNAASKERAPLPGLALACLFVNLL